MVKVTKSKSKVFRNTTCKIRVSIIYIYLYINLFYILIYKLWRQIKWNQRNKGDTEFSTDFDVNKINIVVEIELSYTTLIFVCGKLV